MSTDAVVPWVDRRPLYVRRVQRHLVRPGRIVWVLLNGRYFSVPMPSVWGASLPEIGAALRDGSSKTLFPTCRGPAAWISRGNNRLYVRGGEARTVTHPGSLPLLAGGLGWLSRPLEILGCEPVNARRGRVLAKGPQGRVTVEGRYRHLAIFKAFVGPADSER